MCAVSSYNAEGRSISVLALAQINVGIFPQVVRFLKIQRGLEVKAFSEEFVMRFN